MERDEADILRGLDLASEVLALKNGTRLVLFYFAARKFLKPGSTAAALAQYLLETGEGRNVLCLDEANRVLWRIADPGRHPSGRPDPFVELREADGGVIGHTWSGFDYAINAADGSVKELGWTKM
jgi:hypothetical protein